MSDDEEQEIKKMIKGLNLIHKYKEIDDWDGNGCSDYCIGCGDCDHFPISYAVLVDTKILKTIMYYCSKCFDDCRTQSDYFGLRFDVNNKNCDIELEANKF